MLRWLAASFHLLAFGIGLGAVWVRGRNLAGLPDPDSLKRTLQADNWWGIAAVFWLASGLPRLLAGLEKPTSYYLSNHLFWLKMGLFGLVFLLEMAPMMGLIRWRLALAKGKTPDLARGAQYSRISRLQAVVLLIMLFVATAVARGYGARG
jgi:putative membrane protein